MKTLIILFAISIAQFSFGQIVNIPDANFKSILLSNNEINTNADNEIQLSEANAYDGAIYCYQQEITDLTGIDAFVNLKILNCAINELTSLDVTKNVDLEILICAANQLSSIDVTQNTVLKELVFSHNYISEIDISQNPNLYRLEFESNNITSVDLSVIPLLKRIICSGNSLGQLDFSPHSQLEFVQANGVGLTSFDISANPGMRHLEIMYNGIEVLDFSNNILLEWMRCDINSISTLDLSQNINLEKVGVFNCDELEFLNLANGNNELISNTSIQANSCESLICIKVDDVNYSLANWSDRVDDISLFSETCGSLDIGMTDLETIEIFPNPATNSLSFSGAQVKIDQIEIFNSVGQKVLVESLVTSLNETTINIEELPSGVYTVLFSADEQNNLVKRFVKE